MPPTGYHWRFEHDAAYLDYNAGNVASVRRRRDGKLWTRIRFRQQTHEAPCGSVQQGVRWINRWIERQPGFPGGGKVHWYDRLPDTAHLQRELLAIQGPAPFRPNG